MKVTYDPQADALYLSFRESEVARTQEAGEGIQLDYDEADRIIGIEILGYSERVDPESLKSVSFSLPLAG